MNRTEGRSLIISDFRNLGISDSSSNLPGKSVLKINRCLRRECLGGLVVILGSNNSGKSNVLDALSKVRKQNFDDGEDRCDFVRVPKKPQVEFEVASGKYGKLETPIIIPGIQRCTVEGSFGEVLAYILNQKESFTEYSNYFSMDDERANDIERYMNNNMDFRKGEKHEDDSEAYMAAILRNRRDLQCGELDELASALENGEFDSVKNREVRISVKGRSIDEVELVNYELGKLGNAIGIKPRFVRKDRIGEFNSSQNKIKAIARKTASTISGGKRPSIDFDVKFIDLTGGPKETVTVQDAFSDEYGYNLSNNVYQYHRRKISKTDFTSGISEPNEFISSLFSILGYDMKSVLDRHYLESAEVRKKLENELNEELISVSNELNELISVDERKYFMSIRLEKEEIRFSLTCGEDVTVNIDHQSEGFRWIFEFFLNFLKSKSFIEGDMAIIDEFGGLLNFNTVKKLTDYLRRFGRKHGITFILATQNPMSVNINHLEEIRIVVPRTTGESVILNDFTEFGYNGGSDVLKPIVSSLTVGRNYLKSSAASTVFVTDYRDYFTLVKFAQLLKRELDVIPLAGMENAEPEEIAENIQEIDSHPVLLVNGDKASEEYRLRMKKLGVDICTVCDVFGDADNTMELLSSEDKFPQDLSDSSFDETYSHMQTLDSRNLSDTSLNRIGEFLDYIWL